MEDRKHRERQRERSGAWSLYGFQDDVLRRTYFPQPDPTPQIPTTSLQTHILGTESWGTFQIQTTHHENNWPQTFSPFSLKNFSNRSPTSSLQLNDT
jgi:hypothetical protein